MNKKKKKKMVTLVNGAVVVAVVTWFAVASHAQDNGGEFYTGLSATSVTIDY